MKDERGNELTIEALIWELEYQARIQKDYEIHEKAKQLRVILAMREFSKSLNLENLMKEDQKSGK